LSLIVSFPQRKLRVDEDIPIRARSFKPRPYQVEGINFLRNNPRAILADAPGLGKTFQAAEGVHGCNRKIVCVPLVLADQWADFLNDQYPEDGVSVACYGDVLKRDASLNAFDAGTTKWLIVNHDMLRTYYLPPCDALIIDESHHFRNRAAARSEGMLKMAKRTPRIVQLTATPIFRDVSDLWHQLHLLDQKEWSSYWSFLDRYAVTTDRGFGAKVLRRRNVKQLDELLTKWMLSRSYKDVGLYLPERIDKHVVMRMTDAQLRVYDRLRYEYKLELPDGKVDRFMNAGAVLHKLRMLTVTKEKIAAIEEIVNDTPDNKPVIVFCWYRSTADKLATALNAELITGAIDANERRELAVHSDKRVRVITMESLSEGADLSESRTVIFAEETYVPGQAYQALSRVQRHSTDPDPVVVYWVRYRQTVDQIVHDAVRARISDAHAILREALE
jgi:superfamily II DNA or RNA helicase